MNYETVTLDRDARGVTTLTLNRPDKHNALNAQLIAPMINRGLLIATDDADRVTCGVQLLQQFCHTGSNRNL